MSQQEEEKAVEKKIRRKRGDNVDSKAQLSSKEIEKSEMMMGLGLP